MTGTATFSPCGKYRYDLTRTWGDEPPIIWIGLNPSTADATVDDATMRRVTAFSKREGAGGFVMLNLFALRSTDPAGLLSEADPCGPNNLVTVRRHISTAQTVIAAWGAHKTVSRSMVRLHLADDMRQAGRTLWCLGKTSDGRPRHPLYVKGDAPLVAFT